MSASTKFVVLDKSKDVVMLDEFSEVGHFLSTEVSRLYSTARPPLDELVTRVACGYVESRLYRANQSERPVRVTDTLSVWRRGPSLAESHPRAYAAALTAYVFLPALWAGGALVLRRGADEQRRLTYNPDDHMVYEAGSAVLPGVMREMLVAGWDVVL